MRFLGSLLCTAALAAAQTVEQPVRAVTDPGTVTTRQAITPAGVPSVFQGRVYGIAWGKSPDDLWVLHATHVYRMNWRQNEVLDRLAHGGTPGLQSLRADGDGVILGNAVRLTSAARGPAKAQLVRATPGSSKVIATGLGDYLTGAVALARQGTRQIALLPLTHGNKLIAVDTTSGEQLWTADTGIAPFAAVVNAAGTAAYVSNWGGRIARGSEPFASPMQKPNEKVPVDSRGVASTGTITRIDLTTHQVTHTITVGLHPTGMVWDEARQRLYVANGNSDSVSVVDTTANTVRQTITLQPFSEQVRGIAPTAVAVSNDGSQLFVACGGINAVAVVDAKSGSLRGLLPTGWYPNALALSPDGQHLAVASLLGAGSGWRDAPAKRFVHSNRGSVAVIPLPDAAQLASYSTAVAENNHVRLAGSATPADRAPRDGVKAAAVPMRSGEPSLIEHVVYIVKENRTYDQVLGDVKKGNGDPSLVMFGEQVTPNQHRIADQFVLLDNFYATGGNSADGHQWVTQANETDYCLWPGYVGRSYPFDGSDPMAYSSGGFIWDYALARGKSVRIYGEYAGRAAEPTNRQRMDLLERWKKGEDFTKEWRTRAPIDSVNKILAANYPAYTTAIPDVARAQIFLQDLKRFTTEGKMPHLTIVQLPSDHTFGATPGVSSPRAMVADNDYAVGQIVEALTRSPFWQKMAIFIVEDDAQNGVDHVDGHRTTAFLISPYVRRGQVDSTFYSHQSMLKTMELMLGLPTMSLFDLIAHDMRLSFTDKPDLTPYTAVAPQYDLFEINPSATALKGPARQAAVASARMNWSVPDAVPTEKLNRILWGQIRGWNTPYPGTRKAVFSPLSLDTDDDDR